MHPAVPVPDIARLPRRRAPDSPGDALVVFRAVSVRACAHVGESAHTWSRCLVYNRSLTADLWQ